MSFSGSCHCGKLSFELDDQPSQAIRCNCSICRRKGYVLAFSTPDKFKTDAAKEDVGVYTFGKGHIQHQFCKSCGCAPFGEGTDPAGNKMIAINLSCSDLDLSTITIQDVDGANL